jgi:saccharopine dehydrogenase-like NADP-dependent oxidoreductase
MSKRNTVFVAGAGGIGSAVSLLLRELGDLRINIYIGDKDYETASTTQDWLCETATEQGFVKAIHMPSEGTNDSLEAALVDSDIILDCLPGKQAPRLAKLARKHNLHYANLTEYVKETAEVVKIAQGAEQGFVLQTGLAPGFINVLANGLFNQFCQEYGVDKVDYVSMKVGALTKYAIAPYYYGFTWSPIGVATEYIEPTVVVRNFQKTTIPALSERSVVIINGNVYEEDLTSGGTADLPEALAGKAKNLDYKTLRYPGHYDWVHNLCLSLAQENDGDIADLLQEKMEEQIPSVEGDIVVLYASVQGLDQKGRLRAKEKAYHVEPMEIHGKKLRAIQSTTAAPLAECTRALLEGQYRGVVLQSQIDFDDFMRGTFVSTVYG